MNRKLFNDRSKARTPDIFTGGNDLTMQMLEANIQRDIDEATAELTKLEAMKVLLGNNSFACEVEIMNIKIGICDNSWMIPVIDKQIEEITKFLNNEPNSWQ